VCHAVHGLRTPGGGSGGTGRVGRRRRAVVVRRRPVRHCRRRLMMTTMMRRLDNCRRRRRPRRRVVVGHLVAHRAPLPVHLHRVFVVDIAAYRRNINCSLNSRHRATESARAFTFSLSYAFVINIQFGFLQFDCNSSALRPFDDPRS